VSHDQRRDAPAGTAIHTVHIASTDAAGLNLHQDIVRAKFWYRDIFISKKIVFFENQGFHIISILVGILSRDQGRQHRFYVYLVGGFMLLV
jgi:hypothetical protein